MRLMAWPAFIAAVIAAYLIGAIPFGLLLGLARGVDIRERGSGNIGATNLGRACGRIWGLVGFALDVAKGLVPTLIAGLAFGWLGHDALGPAQAGRWLAIAAAAIVGHVFPVYLKFRGGKGVATGFGVLLGLWPFLALPGAGALVTWLLFAGALRYVGLASVMAAVLLPGYCFLLLVAADYDLARTWPFPAVAAGMALLVVVRHRTNLKRLIRGTEAQLGE